MANNVLPENLRKEDGHGSVKINPTFVEVSNTDPIPVSGTFIVEFPDVQDVNVVSSVTLNVDTGLLQSLTDAELRASPVFTTDVYSEFYRIKNKRYSDAEEVRYDIPTNLAANSIYIGVADDGTLTADSVWTVIRVYFDANGSPNRERIRFNVAWDDRTLGW